MATETLSSIVESAMAEVLPRLVEAVAKHLKSGKTVDEVVDAIADQKLPISRGSKSRSNSEPRKTPSSRSTSRALGSKTTSSKKKSDKSPKWVSFDEYREDHADRDVCTFVPSRGENATKVCCADVEDAVTSDTSRVRCPTHKKSDLDASAQRFSKNISSTRRRSTDDDPEVNDNHRPPLGRVGTAGVRSTRGVPTALSGRSKTEAVSSQSQNSDAEVSDTDKPGLTSSSRRAAGAAGVASRISRLSANRADSDQKPSEIRRNLLASRMTRKSDPEPEASEHETSTRQSVGDSARVRVTRSRSASKEPESRSARIMRSTRESAESPKRPLRSRDTLESTLSKEESRSSPRETEPEDDDNKGRRSVRATRATRREPTPDPEPIPEKDAEHHSEREETKSRRPSRREPTPESRESTPVQADGDSDEPELVSYTVPNVADVEWIKLGDSKFLGVDGTKALGIYPLEIKNGVKLPPIWKSKLVKKDFDDATLNLIKKLDLELP